MSDLERLGGAQAIEIIRHIVGGTVELKEEGQDDHGIDFVVSAGNQRFLIAAKATSRSFAMELGWRSVSRAARGHEIPLLFVPHMTRPNQVFCEDRGINWVDLAGNARIRSPRLIVLVEGRQKRATRGRPTSVFERRSSRIARLLLQQPGRSWTVSTCAVESGLNQGHVSRIFAKLVEESLVRREGREHHVVDPQALLDAWRDGSMPRHRVVSGHVAARGGEELMHVLAERLGAMKVEHAATGLAAAWLYDHYALFRLTSFYVRPGLDPQQLVHLGFTEQSTGPNVWLIVPGDEGVFGGAREVEGVRCVHPVQVYVDLKDQPERSDEATAHLRQNPLLLGAAHGP